jgi:hypothetical protein
MDGKLTFGTTRRPLIKQCACLSFCIFVGTSRAKLIEVTLWVYLWKLNKINLTRFHLKEL